MKIKKSDLEKLINECVGAKMDELAETAPPVPGAPSGGGINWDEMKYLHGRGKLYGKWHVIMTAYLENDENADKALASLKAAVATLEAKGLGQPPKDQEMASMEDLTDFSKL